jgi:glutaminyl-tRNA synthetase
VRWLGFEWDGPTRYASGYFDEYYELALGLIEDGRAYVDSLSEEEIRAYRGTVTEPGRPSPYRDRPPEESLELFRGMREGRFEDGAHVLRAKIDLASPNMKMRDPLLYRIRHASHYRTRDEWPIYPFYDWAHPLGDAIEGVTHSLCTLEFENNRELYDWVVDHTRPARIGLAGSPEPGAWDPRPRQYEFARFNLDYTVMSKRKLAALVREGRVEGWDDPRMPTLAALRRRGVTPDAIRAFCDLVGISRADRRADIGKLEHAVRDDLNWKAPRVMCVLDPLRLVIENYPEGEEEWLEAPHFPRDVPRQESREVPFSRVLHIERDDFREDPPEGFYRLAPGREVRLRYAYLVTCTDVVRDPGTGEVVEVRCTYDPATRGGAAPDGRRVRGTLHWVSAPHAATAEVRLYDRLFRVPDPEAGTDDFRAHLNADSLVVVSEARIEPGVADDPPGSRYQFERLGYFIRDPGATEGLVFNRTVGLRDTWARRHGAGAQRAAAGNGGGGPEAATASEPAGSRAAGSGDDGGKPRGRPVGDGRPSGRSEDRERARAERPALAERYARWQEAFGLSEEDADILTGDPALARFFEAAMAAGPDPRPVANWLIHELRGSMGDRTIDELPFGGEALGVLVGLVEEGTISQAVAKDLLDRLLEEGGDPRRMVEAEGLEKIDDRERLATIVDELVSRNPEKVDRFREGQTGLAGFFVGQVMRRTEGRADPRLVQELVRDRLS